MEDYVNIAASGRLHTVKAEGIHYIDWQNIQFDKEDEVYRPKSAVIYLVAGGFITTHREYEINALIALFEIEDISFKDAFEYLRMK